MKVSMFIDEHIRLLLLLFLFG